MTKYFVLLLALMLNACGSPILRQPPAFEMAQDADKEARRSLRGGELIRARNNFTKALSLQQSLDDQAGAAATLINLATVAHRLHDNEAALVWLDRILKEKMPIYPPAFFITAAFHRAVILTNMGRLYEADSSLQISDDLCKNKCALRAGINTLRARLSLLKGDANGALILAQTVLSEEDEKTGEQANAQRIIAAAEEMLARNILALQHYQAALELDKAQGRSARIVEDLNGMARVSTRLGRDQDAAAYTRRAVLVNEALRHSISQKNGLQ